MKDLITPEQRANLEKLAAYLESGNLKAEFDMSDFSDNPWRVSNDCGTVGCAVGHGPYAGIEKRPFEFWVNYCHRVFLNENTNEQKIAWEFLFSESWAETPFNQAIHAAKRIRHFLNGLPIDITDEYGIEEYSRTPECENIHK